MPARGDAGGVRAVLLRGLGPFPRALAEEVAARASERVPVPWRLRLDLPDLPAPLLPGREQADAGPLLSALEAEPLEPGHAVVGITLRDLGIPIFTYIFGQARVGGRAALVSTARLSPEFYGFPPDPGLLADRAVAEVLHEVGHLAGLRHCAGHDCLMHFAATVEAIDLRGPSFCGRCALALQAMLHPRPG